MNLPAVDTSLFFFINSKLRNSVFDSLMPFVTARPYLFFLPLYLWLLLKDRKKAFIALILGFAALCVSDWTANMLKHYFERVRPCNGLADVRILVGCTGSFSMPSNHAVNSFAFITPFYILSKNRIRYAFVAVAALVGFSRIYVGVHYPSDVIAGALLGILLSICVIGLYSWSAKRSEREPYSTALIIFLLVLGLFRIYYIMNSPIDLSPDEAHYWEWSRRLDLSYYSKGPAVAYLIYLGTHIFGDTVFGIRIMAVIFSTLGSIFLYIMGKKAYDEKVGLSSAVLIQIIPLFSVYGILFTIDSPFTFFWILSLFLLWKVINSQSSVENRAENRESQGSNPGSLIYWCLLGLSIGFGLLTKYTMAFFYPCAFLVLLTSKEHRKLLLTKEPYIAFALSILIFSPVIMWNAGHDWVTLRHTAGQAHMANGIRISLKSFIDFIGSQLGVITPLLFILMSISVWKLREERNGKFLFWFSVPVFVFFLLKSLQAKVQANWALPGYITGVIAFSAFYIKGFYSHSKGKRILIGTAVFLSLIVTGVAHYHSVLDLPAKMDPASRLIGWRELGGEVSTIYEQMLSAHPVFIFSDSYQVSSELAFYVKGHPVTYCINLGRRMNQYDFWPAFEKLIHYNAIFVETGDNGVPGRIKDAFGNVEKKVFTAYTKRRIKIREYSIFLCYDFKGLKEQKPETY
jgi:4-amino-4-deoxy-L-arabinose transferase-like glycosyltransferase/membrane-associated phospholipid phosphatase